MRIQTDVLIPLVIGLSLGFGASRLTGPQTLIVCAQGPRDPSTITIGGDTVTIGMTKEASLSSHASPK